MVQLLLLLLLSLVLSCGAEQTNILTEGNLRLVGGRTPLEGRLEILYMGFWGTICDDYWEIWLEGAVACRQMGFFTGEDFSGNRGVLPSDVPILLDDVMCTGLEDWLVDCYHSNWAVSDCMHDEDVYLKCGGHYDDVRLVGSVLPHQGRVEVFQGGRWGTVCDTDGSWNTDSSDVLCRQLGYSRSLGSVANSLFGKYSEEILIRHEHCYGYERSLKECQYSNDTTGCGHWADVAVICDSETNSDYSQYTIWSVTELCLILFFIICTILPALVMFVKRVRRRRQQRRELAHISGSAGFENPNYLCTPADMSSFQPTGYPTIPPSYEESQLDGENPSGSGPAPDQTNDPNAPRVLVPYASLQPASLASFIPTAPPAFDVVNSQYDEDNKDEEGGSGTYTFTPLTEDEECMPPPYSPVDDPTLG